MPLAISAHFHDGVPRKVDTLVLQYASEELKNDREFVLAAVESDGFSLCLTLEDFKNDREIVFAAVKKRGLALVYASEDLRKDREIVLAAVKNMALYCSMRRLNFAKIARLCSQR